MDIGLVLNLYAVSSAVILGLVAVAVVWAFPHLFVSGAVEPESGAELYSELRTSSEPTVRL